MRNPDTTTAPTSDRRITDQWTLTGPSLSGNPNTTPAIELTTTHVKDRKAIVARFSYVELERNDRYSILHWQTDWPYITIENEKTPRYSRKALEAVRDRALKRIADRDFTHNTALWLTDRIDPVEVAA